MAEASEEELSPKNPLKFLCSYGGKILPRPSDGQLKYVGGDTRVVAVPRSVTFSELMEKLKAMYPAEALMKYQLMPEDIDALISVTCDEDLRHMLDEYDRHDQPSASPRLRVFLFPAKPTAGMHSVSSPLEQRYVDAINGLPLLPAAAAAGRSIFTLSSPTTMSPTSSLDASAASALSQELRLGPRLTGLSGGMHRVRSTPNMTNFHSQLGGSGSGPSSPRFQLHQPPPSLQKQRSVTYGAHSGPLGGHWRSGIMAHAGNSGAVRYDASGLHKMSFQPQPLRPYYYGASSTNSLNMGAGGGCGCSGHADEAFVPPRFRQCSSRYGSPPPNKQTWE